MAAGGTDLDQCVAKRRHGRDGAGSGLVEPSQGTGGQARAAPSTTAASAGGHGASSASPGEADGTPRPHAAIVQTETDPDHSHGGAVAVGERIVRFRIATHSAVQPDTSPRVHVREGVGRAIGPTVGCFATAAVGPATGSTDDFL